MLLCHVSFPEAGMLCMPHSSHIVKIFLDKIILPIVKDFNDILSKFTIVLCPHLVVSICLISLFPF